MKKLITILLLAISGIASAQTYQLNYPDIRVGSSNTGKISLRGNNIRMPYIPIGSDIDSVMTILDGVIKKVPRSQFNIVQNSLSPNSTTLSPSVTAVNSRTPYVTPEDYGAIGDGVVNDKSAIQSAVNSGKNVLLAKKYYVSDSILISVPILISGGGEIITNTNKPILSIKSNDVTIEGIKFKGNGRLTSVNYVTNQPKQTALSVYGSSDLTINYKNIKVSNCRFYNLGGYGVNVTFNYSNQYSGGIQITNSVADSCFVGYYFGNRAEYSQMSNVKAFNCEVGVEMLGGNNSIINPNFDNNRTGILLETSQNPGHSTVTGGSINHSKDLAINSLGEDGGYIFNGVEILVNGKISITNSDKIQFYNCDIIAPNIDVVSSTNTVFKNCKFDTTPTFTGINSIAFYSTIWGSTPPIGAFDYVDNDIILSKTPPTFSTGGAELLVRNVSTFKLEKLGYTPYNPSSYPVNSGGETLASVLARGNSANLNIGLGGSALSGGSASNWLTLNGTTTYSGGLVYSLNGIAKGYNYIDNNDISISGNSGVGLKFFANGSITPSLEVNKLTGAVMVSSPPSGPTDVSRKQELDLKQNLITLTTTSSPTSFNQALGTLNVQPTDLSNYVTLNTAQTISGTKSFAQTNYFENSTTYPVQKIQINPIAVTALSTSSPLSTTLQFNGIQFNYNSFNLRFSAPVLTQNSVVSVQDKAGTMALISDINAPSISTKTANYTVLLTDYTLVANTTSSAITFTLPTAASAYNATTGAGNVFSFKRNDSGTTNALTIQANGAELIDGTNTKVITSAYGGFTVQSTGTTWIIKM